jgi:hypothetical protein
MNSQLANKPIREFKDADPQSGFSDFLVPGDLRGTLSNASHILNPRMGEGPVSTAVALVRGRGSQPSQHPVAIRLTTAAPRFSASLLSRSRLRAKRGCELHRLVSPPDSHKGFVARRS